MANMIEAEVVKDHETPVFVFQFTGDMSCNVVVDLGEILAC